MTTNETNDATNVKNIVKITWILATESQITKEPKKIVCKDIFKK